MWKVILIFIFSFTLSLGSYRDNWNGILKDYSREGSRDGIEAVLVDYSGIQNDKRWTALLDELKTINHTSLSPDESKSFWINVYNIAAVKMVLDNHPLKSIKDAGSFFKPVWDREVITIDNKSYSLGYIEHKILRKTGDSLIHYAIVCASMSCPDLKREAYTPDRVQEQMEEQKRRFLASESKGIRLEEDTYYISKLYKWYKDDFGDPYIYLDIPRDKKIKFMGYNWSLNTK